MRCEEIMKRDVECLEPTEAVQEAARKMRDENVGFLPVCDNDKKIVGTLTDRDIAIRVVAENRPLSTAVREIMSREVVSCRASDDLHRAEQLMARHQKSRMLCVDDAGRIVGVISLSDIAKRADAGEAAQTMRQIAEREAHAS